MSLRAASRRLREDGAPLTAREVAELCGVELKTVHNWVAQRLLLHFRTPGRHLRFQPAAVREFLEQCGYVPPDAPQAARVLVLAPQSRRASLRRALGECEVLWVAEALTALIVAGRETPSVICLHAEALGGLNGSDMVRALRGQLPRSRLVWMGSRKGLGSARVRVVAADEYEAIATYVKVR